MSIQFPIYRKYPNNRSFFKINSWTEFDEIQFVGSRGVLSMVEASAYPEKLRIKDMLELCGGYWLESDSGEFEQARMSCQER